MVELLRLALPMVVSQGAFAVMIFTDRYFMPQIDPAEENEPPQVEPDVETATPSELSEGSPVPDVTTAELSVEEAIVDQVAAPTPEEKERTMH